MAKKKNISSSDIISLYMDYVITHDAQPKSVSSFAKYHKFEESVFYDNFSSFDMLEKHIFKAFFDNTMHILHKSKEYKDFDARNQLLSFYFSFFENLSINRSYVIYALERHKNLLKSLSALSILKTSFTDYISSLDIELIDLKQEQLNQIQKSGLKESSWLQLLLTLKFWLDDSSPNYEKTDIFIEKSINTSFDVLSVVPLKSLIDLGKFIYKEKIQMP